MISSLAGSEDDHLGNGTLGALKGIDAKEFLSCCSAYEGTVAIALKDISLSN